jgi:hypothetical protein
MGVYRSLLIWSGLQTIFISELFLTETSPEPELPPVPTTVSTTVEPTPSTGQCFLPIDPSDDPDVTPETGIRFGEYSFFEYADVMMSLYNKRDNNLKIRIKRTTLTYRQWRDIQKDF